MGLGKKAYYRKQKNLTQDEAMAQNVEEHAETSEPTAALPWEDDGSFRVVVYLGHKCELISPGKISCNLCRRRCLCDCI